MCDWAYSRMGYIHLGKEIYMINMANVVGELQYFFLVKH